MVNNLFSVYSKSGARLAGPARLSSIWTDNDVQECQDHGSGDPIVLYDEYADRWILTEFAIENRATGPYYQCIAVSETDNPTGFYHLYQYEIDEFNDYPKFGVGHDGYLYTYVDVDNGMTGVVGAFERNRMLNGQDAAWVHIDVESGTLVLPADWDGQLPANPFDTPRIFAGLRISNTNNGDHEIPIFRLNVDWAFPENATLTEVETLHPLWFEMNVCADANFRCIEQPSGAPNLDALSDRLMFPLTIRDMGTHLAMTVNHTVSDGAGAGIRWYEFRSPDNGEFWQIFQESTYSPGFDHYWMGSSAINADGDIGLIYTVSGNSEFPSIRWTGRRSNDPLGDMTIDEVNVVPGLEAQNGTSRWGDYASLVVDPVDGHTFWGTHEFATNELPNANWNTQIFSFQIPDDDPDPPDDPEPLTVTIQGPDQMEPDETGTWDFVISGGTQPYSCSSSHQFTPNCDGDDSCPGPQIGHGVGCDGYTWGGYGLEGTLGIGVTVTDSGTQTASANKQVTVESSALLVSISGPSSCQVNQTCTWTANVSGGSGPSSYDWYWRRSCLQGPQGSPNTTESDPGPQDVPICEWYGNGSNQTYSLSRPQTGAIQIRVIVTRGSQTMSRIKSVSIVSGASLVAEGETAETTEASLLMVSSMTVDAPPDEVVLKSARPNPFSSNTELSLGLPEEMNVRLALYDVLGREVLLLVNDVLPAGWHSAILNGSALAAGVHLVRLETNGEARTIRITRVR